MFVPPAPVLARFALSMVMPRTHTRWFVPTPTTDLDQFQATEPSTITSLNHKRTLVSRAGGTKLRALGELPALLMIVAILTFSFFYTNRLIDAQLLVDKPKALVEPKALR